jgi:hypothetical protein
VRADPGPMRHDQDPSGPWKHGRVRVNPRPLVRPLGCVTVPAWPSVTPKGVQECSHGWSPGAPGRNPWSAGVPYHCRPGRAEDGLRRVCPRPGGPPPLEVGEAMIVDGSHHQMIGPPVPLSTVAGRSHRFGGQCPVSAGATPGRVAGTPKLSGRQPSLWHELNRNGDSGPAVWAGTTMGNHYIPRSAEQEN